MQRYAGHPGQIGSHRGASSSRRRGCRHARRAARHFLGHQRRCRHRYEGSDAVTGEGPDAKGGEKEESAAAREWARGEGRGEAAMRAREKQENRRGTREKEPASRIERVGSAR